MNFNQLGMHALRLRLVFERFGWGLNIAGALGILGVIAWVWGIPYLNAQENASKLQLIKNQQKRLADESNSAAERHTTPEENYQHFKNVLGDPVDTEKQIAVFFQLARKTGLTLSKAEYKLADDKEGRYRTYQILLPVKGSYKAIREFCEKSLLAIPFASLDEMSFKRESISRGVLEARLRFTLYLSETGASVAKSGMKSTDLQKDVT